MSDARQNLIRILQNAHAGELAAAFAYRGHRKSLRKTADVFCMQGRKRQCPGIH